ncbi:hypothetical protein L3Q82_013775, partial [Scortum barcoo]
MAGHSPSGFFGRQQNSWFHLSQQVFQVLKQQEQPQTITLPPPYFTVVMAFIRLVMLSASLVLLLLWTTSLAQSHDLLLTNRVRRDQPFETREKVKGTFEVVNDALSAIKDISESNKWGESVKDYLKKLAKFASVAPGCISAIFSGINAVLAFIPQDNPVLNAVKEGFAEVNRKLDSISIQISNLAVDVEWFNYASVYSQDEVRILSAWRKLAEFCESSKSAQSREEKLRLSEIFINYYEYTGTEASVANLYHYLTVSNTSLSGNLNQLMKKKFRCDIREIGRYNFFFNSLLVQGAVLNEVYWTLIGLDPSNKEDNRAEMFQNVYAAQSAVVDFCLDNYEKYMKEDVVKIAKENSPDNKQAIADQVKKELDDKYDWYKWVVLVYDTDQEANYKLFELTKIPVGKLTIAVGHTMKAQAQELYGGPLIQGATRCFEGQNCDIQGRLHSCKFLLPSTPQSPGSTILPLRDYIKATHVVYGTTHVERLIPLQQVDFSWGGYTSQISVHYSRRMLACSSQTCWNNGRCKRLLDSNDYLCECQSGYYGETCREKMDLSVIKEAVAPYPLLTVTSTSARMKMIESKLEQILRTVNDRC